MFTEIAKNNRKFNCQLFHIIWNIGQYYLEVLKLYKVRYQWDTVKVSRFYDISQMQK